MLTAQRAFGVFGLLVAVGAASIGPAFADPDQDSGPSRNQSSSRQVGKPADSGPPARQGGNKTPAQPPGATGGKHVDGPAAFDATKVQTAVRDDATEVAAAAAAMRDFLEDTSSFTLSPVAQQAVLGPGGPVPTVGMGGLVSNARALAAYIADRYPTVQAIGGVRSDPLPDHPSGHAIDIMTGSDMGLGDAINADVQSQAGRFGVKYTLWRVANHFNHVHVTVF